jgi:hypothetical protein
MESPGSFKTLLLGACGVVARRRR